MVALRCCQVLLVSLYSRTTMGIGGGRVEARFLCPAAEKGAAMGQL